MRRDKRVKKATGGAGSPPAASDVEKRAAAETTTNGNGQELVVAGRGIEIGSKEWKEFRKELSTRVHTRQFKPQV
jgi:hypothetical protein